MQRIHLKHHMLRGHWDIAFSLHLVIDLGRFTFPLPFSPFKNGWASCSYPTGYVFEEKALLAFRDLLDKDFECLELWLAPYQSTLVAEPTRLPTQLYYHHFILNFNYIEPNASLPLLRCRDPHALRAVLAWATYILQHVFFELSFFAFTWGGHRQGLLHPSLLE